MNYFIPFLFLILSSCATLKPHSLQESLRLINLEGEGRGRIGYVDQNYLFRFESAFREKNWLLNLTVPMHGEELLVFEELDKNVSNKKMQSLELQIDQSVKRQTKLDKLQDVNVVSHLRSLVRFAQAEKLGLDINCHSYKCYLDEEEFLVTPISDGVEIRKYVKDNYYVELAAVYLEKNYYSRTNFFLKKEESKENLFSLELFWKNK